MAQIIHDKLLERGITSFLDLEELRSGKFDEKILTAIESASSFILILPKNALNRCRNQDDWVRTEILAACRYQKRIIPVMYDGFKWPKQWHADIPQEIRDLEKMNGVSGTQEYLGAMIKKIISFLPENVHRSAQEPKEEVALPLPTISFFTKCWRHTQARLKRLICVFMPELSGGKTLTKLIFYLTAFGRKLRFESFPTQQNH